MFERSKGHSIGQKYVPFSFDADVAKDELKKWLGKGFMLAKDAADNIAIDRVQKVYVPFYLFNCDYAVPWTADEGHHRHEDRYNSSSGKTESVKLTEWRQVQGTVRGDLRDMVLASKDINRALRGFFEKTQWDGLPMQDWANADKSDGATILPFDQNPGDIFRKKFESKILRDIEHEIERSIYGDEKREIRWQKSLNFQWIDLYMPFYSIEYTYAGRKEFKASIDASTYGRIEGKKPRRDMFAGVKSLFGRKKAEDNV